MTRDELLAKLEAELLSGTPDEIGPYDPVWCAWRRRELMEPQTFLAMVARCS